MTSFPLPCGEGALIKLFEPAMTVKVNGVVSATPLMVSSRPDGFESNVKSTVCGDSRMDFVS